MDRDKPWKIGRVESRDSFPQEQVRAHKRRVSGAANAKDLLDEYAFYSPALLYLRVRLMGRDPYLNFVQEYGKDVLPFLLEFSRPLFQGLNRGPDESWNHQLLGMEREPFEAFRQWLGTLTFTDRELNLVSRVRYSDIQIADPLHMEKLVVLPREIPLIPVTMVCLETNQGSWYVETGPSPLMDLPTVRFTREVRPETQAFADAILHGLPNPYDAVEDDWEEELIERVRRAREGKQP